MWNFCDNSQPRSSLPGLTRQSIPLGRNALGDNGMDARIKSGHVRYRASRYLSA
jgi:hypothetical protein